MPELPEVETVRLSLLPHIKGKTIAKVKVNHKATTRTDPTLPRKLKGKKITNIRRRGKLLIFDLDDPNLHLLCHLKMTGQLLYHKKRIKGGGGHTLSNADLELPNKHTRAEIHFTDGSILYFNDLRIFGYLKTVKPNELEVILSKYGIEPGLDNFTLEAFIDVFKKRNTNVKALLLNQGVISGLGNIYVDEACYFAKVKPTRNVKRLTKEEKKLLHKACQSVITQALAAGGTTFYSFKSSDGSKGEYFDELKVFARSGKPCLRCQGTIKKIKHAGRGTHFCPSCQK